ncbi:hypothetical protein NWF32_19350 [Pseudomonas qingdaonensis]|nr:hypothetical protein [Pseudomonas qingdaonensis]
MAEKQMTHSTSYTNLILVAGYAGYFAFWSTLVTKLPSWLYALSGLLALLSLLLFISWEVIKMTWGTVHLNRINKMIIKTVRGPNVLQIIDAASSLQNVRTNKLWLWFLVPTLIFGIGPGCCCWGTLLSKFGRPFSDSRHASVLKASNVWQIHTNQPKLRMSYGNP